VASPIFITEDFLLHNKTARRLYHDYAAGLPIVDYHCHLNPHQIADNHRFKDICELWINCDPYKWRAMRMNGVREELITGDASPESRFMAWARTLQHLAGNPLFHWSQMELKRYFGVGELLDPHNALDIQSRCNARLDQAGLSTHGLLKEAKVHTVCTSDDLLDDLETHGAVTREECGFNLLPSLRGDSILAVQAAGFSDWLQRLAESVDVTIQSLDDYKNAVRRRLERFQQAGCLLADHSLELMFFEKVSPKEAASYFSRVLKTEPLEPKELQGLQTSLLLFLGGEYAARNWAMQLHLGAQRQTSSRLRGLLGPAGGFTCIGGGIEIAPLCAFLDRLESQGALPRTILYNLNPTDNEMLASLCGSFVEDEVPCKVQLGPAWWYNDHKDAMERHFTVLGNLSLLSRFIGMTTDSRSFLSYVRHDYFRRILCGLLGRWVQEGQLPMDYEWLGGMVRGICFYNALEWLGIREG
jgi:glucuronate isomerase